MREQLNNNPMVQVALVGVLLIAAGFFVLSSGGGGGEEESEAGLESTTTKTTVKVNAPGSAEEALATALSLANQAVSDAPPPPRPVLNAWKDNKTLVLLFVHDGGIDDRLVKRATRGLAGFREAAVFVVPAAKISRYAAITQGVGVDRVPALVVVTPKNLKHVMPTASVSYGFQSPQSIAQAVIDAGYKGPTVDYHP